MYKKLISLALLVFCFLGASARVLEYKEADGSPRTFYDVGEVTVPNGTLTVTGQNAGVTLNYLGSNGGTFVNPPLTSDNAVTVGNGSTITLTTYGDGVRNLAKLELDTFVLPAVAAAGASANGALLATLPAGAQIIQGSKISVGLFADNGQVQSDTPDLGLGSVKATGAVSVLGGTATFEDIMTGQTMDDANGTTESEVVGTIYVTDTGGVKSVYLNTADTWANGSNLHANGSIFIPYIQANQ